MKIESTFDIGQLIYLARVDDRMERELCPLCGGVGKIKGEDQAGRQHAFDCPARSYYEPDRPVGAAQCHNGQVDVRMGSVVEIQTLTVGQIKIEIGGLSGNSNMGYHDEQTHKRSEGVMCYETGIGSGNVFYVGEGRGGSQPFATEEEARTWGEEEVAVRDATREQEESAPAENEDAEPLEVT